MQENISWLGHSSVRIRTGKQVIYIDPWKLKQGAEIGRASCRERV